MKAKTGILIQLAILRCLALDQRLLLWNVAGKRADPLGHSW